MLDTPTLQGGVRLAQRFTVIALMALSLVISASLLAPYSAAATNFSPYGCTITSGCNKYMEGAVWWDMYSSTVEAIESYRFKGSIGLLEPECTQVILGQHSGIHLWYSSSARAYRLSDGLLLHSQTNPAGGGNNCRLVDGGAVRAHNHINSTSGGLRIDMTSFFQRNFPPTASFSATVRWHINQGTAVAIGGYP